MTSADQPALVTHGLTKRFGARVAVDNVSLSVPRGCVYGLIGPNGAGKTTFMRSVLWFTRPSSGDVSVLGHSMPAGCHEVYRNVGVIIEEPRFHRHISGRDNLRLIARMRGDGSQDRIDNVLERVGLGDRADDRVKGYSLGMRQRLGIARALLGSPDLLILDEPVNGLDPPGIHEMRALLRSLADDGHAVLVSSHLLGELERTCDSVAVLQNGRLVYDGSVQSLTAGDTTRYVVGFSGNPTEAVVAAAKHDLVATAAVVDSASPAMQIVLVSGAGDDAIADVARDLIAAGVRVVHLARESSSLEQRFMDLVASGSEHGPGMAGRG